MVEISPRFTDSVDPDPVVAVQEVLKCKWAMRILIAISTGQSRPSAIERAISGLSHKMLHERLAKLTRLRLVERVELAAKAQRVEYRMTTFGHAIGDVVASIDALTQRFPGADAAHADRRDDTATHLTLR